MAFDHLDVQQRLARKQWKLITSATFRLTAYTGDAMLGTIPLRSVLLILANLLLGTAHSQSWAVFGRALARLGWARRGMGPAVSGISGSLGGWPSSSIRRTCSARAPIRRRSSSLPSTPPSGTSVLAGVGFAVLGIDARVTHRRAC